MSLALRSHSENYDYVGTATSTTMTEPAGAALNDILEFTVILDITTSAFVPPSGWTLKSSGATTKYRWNIYWIRRGSSAPALGISWTTAANWEWGIRAWTGVDPSLADPFESVVATATQTGSTPDPAAVTTKSPNSLVVVVGMSWRGFKAPSGAITGYTTDFDGNSGANTQFAHAVAHKAIAAPTTAEDPGAMSNSVAGSDDMGAVTLVLAQQLPLLVPEAGLPVRGREEATHRPSPQNWTLAVVSAPAAASSIDWAPPIVRSGQPLARAVPANDMVQPTLPLPTASVGFLDAAGPRRSREEPPRLRLATASDAQPPAQLTPYVDWAPPAARAAPAPPRPRPVDGWQLAAIVAAAASTFLALAPAPARAAASSPSIRPVDSGQALAPLQPFPSASPPQFVDPVVRGRAAAPPPRLLPDGSSLAPLQPFPSSVYVPSTEAPRLPATTSPRQPVADLAFPPIQPFTSSLYVPNTELPRLPTAPLSRQPVTDPVLAPLLFSQYVEASRAIPARPPVVNRPLPPAEQLPPLQPFPSQQYLPTADLPARGNVTGPKFPAKPDGSAIDPSSPFPSAVYVPETSQPARSAAPIAARQPIVEAPLPAFAAASLLPWFDPAPPPLHRETSTKRPVSADPATLNALPFVVSVWADFAPPPQQRPSKTRQAFVGDASFFPAVTAQITSWIDFALPPTGSSKAPPRAVPAPDGSTLSPLPPPAAPYDLAPIPRRAAAVGATAAGLRSESPLAPLSTPISTFVDLTPAPRRAAPITGATVRSDLPFAPLPVAVSTFADLAPSVARAPVTPRRITVVNDLPTTAAVPAVGQFFNLAPAPERGKPPADPPLPAPWFFSPLQTAAPSVWADFALPAVRGFVSPVRAPAAPLWNMRGFASAVLVPFVPSGEVVFNPTFPMPVVVPFVPSGEVVPPPSFISGTFPPLIASSAQVFEPFVQRRPDQILSMLDGGTAALLHVGASGRLFLTPLDQLDARTLALRTLRRYISLLNFRREVAPGEDQGRAFRLSLDQIHTEQPKDAGGEANLPSVAFLPGVGSTDTLGIGGVNILDDTLGVEGDGTAIAKYGEYEEQFTIEIVAATVAHRNGLVAGLKQALRMQLEWNETLLTVPELFGAAAEFSLDEVEYVEEPYADQNRRRALLRVSLTVPELFVIRGFPLLDPRVLIELGADIVILPRVDESEL